MQQGSVRPNIGEWNLRIIDVFTPVRMPFRFPLHIPVLHGGRLQEVNLFEFDPLISGKDPIYLPIFCDDRRIQVVVGSKLRLAVQIDRFQLVFVAVLVDGVVTLARSCPRSWCS